MADIDVFSPNPTLRFQDTLRNDWFRIRGQSSTVLGVGYWDGFAWQSRFQFTDTVNTSKGNFVVENSAPTVTFDDGSSTYALKHGGSQLQVKAGSTVALAVEATEVSAKVDVEIERESPTLRFVDTSNTDYAVGAYAGKLEVRHALSTVVATIDNTKLEARVDVEIAKATPKITFADTAATGFEARAQSGSWVLSRAGVDKLSVGSTSTISSQTLDVQTTTPTLKLTETASSAFATLASDTGVLKVSVSGTEKLRVAPTETINFQNLRLSSGAPRMVFENTSGIDYALTATGSDFELWDISGTAVATNFAVQHRTSSGTDRTEFGFFTFVGGQEVTIVPSHDGITTGELDATVRVAESSQIRGVVHVKADTTLMRMGVLVLEDNTGKPWFLWMNPLGGANAELRYSDSDPSSGTASGNLIGGP